MAGAVSTPFKRSLKMWTTGAEWAHSSDLRTDQIQRAFAERTTPLTQATVDRFMPGPDVERFWLTGSVTGARLRVRIPPRENGMTTFPVPIFVGTVTAGPNSTSQVVGRIRARWLLAPVGIAVLTLVVLLAGPPGLILITPICATFVIGFLFLYPPGCADLARRLEVVIADAEARARERR